MNKILISLFCTLLIVIVAEISFYLGTTFPKKTETNPPLRKTTFSQEELDSVHPSYYNDFFPLKYDKEKDKIYINFDPRVFADWRKKMGIDFATWISISTYTKGQVDSLILTYKLKGKISDLNINKIINGEKFLYFKLIGADGVASNFTENFETINKAKIVTLLDGKETPIKIEDFKNNDEIIMEGTADLTKPPKGGSFLIEAKITKL